jgi:UDP-glucose 4-epimerase
MRPLSFEHALVTGGAGFIGSHLVDALVAAGCRVTVIDNLSGGSPANLAHIMDRIEFVQADIRDRDQLLRAATAADVVFHLAAVVSVPSTVEAPVESAQVNQIGTLEVLDAARRRGVRRVVLSSSCAVYGDGTELPKREAMRTGPISPYAAQKRANEVDAGLFNRLYGLETVCLRYFNVYGPRQDPSSAYSGVISIFMTRALSNTPPTIYGDGSQSRDFVFVDDVVQANLLAACTSRGSGEIFNIGTGQVVRIDRLWELIAGVAGSDILPRFEPQRTGDIHSSRADISRAAAALGFSPRVAFGHGLKKTFEWYRQCQSENPEPAGP